MADRELEGEVVKFNGPKATIELSVDVETWWWTEKPGAGSFTQEQRVEGGPDLHAVAVKHCTCGHSVGQHVDAKPMPCEVRGCDCEDMTWCDCPVCEKALYVARSRRTDPPQPEEMMPDAGPERNDRRRSPSDTNQGLGASASAPEVGSTEEEWELAEEALDWIEEEEREASVPEGEEGAELRDEQDWMDAAWEDEWGRQDAPDRETPRLIGYVEEDELPVRGRATLHETPDASRVAVYFRGEET